MRYARAFILTIGLLAIGLVKSGHAAGQEVEPAAVPDASTALGPGDTVSFEIVEDKMTPLHLTVSDTGALPVPYIGNVPVSGKNCAEAAALIKRQLEATDYYTATVKLAIEKIAPPKYHPPMRVKILGRVKTEGLVEIPYGDKLTLSEAISKAAPTEFADLRKVRFTHKGPDGKTVKSIIDVNAILKGSAEDVQLEDGDTIIVPQKLFNFGNEGPG